MTVNIDGLRKSMGALALAGALASGLLAGDVSTAEAQSRARASTAQSAEPSAEGVVNINTATEEELCRLPGIGETKAQAIISTRERRPFQRVEDIMRVRGIGRATFRRLRSMLRVEGRTTLAEPVRRSASRRENSSES